MEDKYDVLRLKNQLCFPLYAVSNMITRKYKPALDRLDLTYTQYIVMMVLWEEKQVNEKFLCETLCLRSNTIAPLLKKLELQKRVRWMRMLPNHYQVGNYFFCHAGVEPYIPLDKQREDDLLWIRKWFIKMYHKDEIIVVGHTPVQHLDFLPVPQFLDNNIILCDTGSFMNGGKLSCVDVLSKKFWQT